ncbi:MAG TPA: trypsin-like peptidase domain-containing protein [Candidatus Micrarchaeia archaeon]|nr:trypsin-like peptidase domain-containing protein [Candidatus Micrarchaeia archaeon]
MRALPRGRTGSRPLWAAAAAALCVAVAACGPATGPTRPRATHRPRAAASPGGATAATLPAAAGRGVLSQALTALQDDYVRVVKRVAPSVVQISTSSDLGSGIVFDARGDIVTNNHVVSGHRHFTVTLADGTVTHGTLVNTFRADDLAVIRVRAKGLHPASFADSSRLQVGDIVMAIGNPLGLQSSVSTGIISATGRTVQEPSGVTLPDVLQTSAAINPGNSGGALVDLAGQVVGIPTLAALDSNLGGSQAPGIGFAIPSDVVSDIAGQIIRHGRVLNSHRAFLGVDVGNVLSADGSPGGAQVAKVVAGDPAARAGIRAQDIIVAVDHRPTLSVDALTSVLAQLRPGERVPVAIVTPSGVHETVTVRLGQVPSSG